MGRRCTARGWIATATTGPDRALRRARRRRRPRAARAAASRKRARRSRPGSRCSAIATTSSCSAPAGRARRTASRARCSSRSALGVPVVATNDVRFLAPRGLRGARGARLHPRGHAARGSARVRAATARSSTCARPTRWRRCSPTCPRRSRTPSRSRAAATSRSSSASRRCRPTRCRPGRRPRSYLREESQRGLEQRWPMHRRAARRARCRATTTTSRLASELDVICQMGFAGLLPDRRGLHPLGARERHPGGPGPRLRRRLARRLCARHHRSRPAAATTCCSSAS